MSLNFENATAFDALHFEQIDQHDETFHVFVARARYTLGPADAEGRATLTLADEQPQLVDEDQYLGKPQRSAVRAESDLAPYKPRCDVLLNGQAHSPTGQPVRVVTTRLRVQLPDTPAAVPEPPQGLNPFMPASMEAMQAWRAAAEKARSSTLPGDVLVDKTVIATGERWLLRAPGLGRMLAGGLRLASLGTVPATPWRLTQAQPFVSQPLSYEYAAGGEVRILAGEPAAKRLRRKDDTPATQPVLLEASEFNPVGRGFATADYLNATGLAHLPAPQLEAPQQPFTAALFWQAVRGKAEFPRPAGYGSVGRAWRLRRDLIGRIEQKAQWDKDEFPKLPPEFDHRYWNAAPDDQQCQHLRGGERVELLNLCAPNHPASTPSPQGTVIRFTVPQQPLWLALGDQQGRYGIKPLVIDTLLIEPDQGRVELVWRAVVSARAELANAQLRMAGSDADRDKLRRLLELQHQANEVAPEVEHVS